MALAPLFAASASGEVGRVAEERVKQRLSSLAIPFVANAGQTDPTVAYYAQTFAGTVFVTRDGKIVYSLPAKRDSDSPRGSSSTAGWSLTEAPVNGRACPAASGLAATHVNYFIGNDPTRWRSGLETYDGVSLGEVWPGISLELKARGSNVEKLFTVEPGADPSKIRMKVEGAESLSVNKAGALVLATGLGAVTLTPPVAWQESGGARHPVEVAYERHGRAYGFGLAGYDPALPVVIDPLVQSTYLGGSDNGSGFAGSGSQSAYALAIHPTSGDVYVAGGTTSTNFPGTAGGAQPAHSVDGRYDDAFVARLNPALTALTQATYLGGNGEDDAFALAIHPISGDVYVAGHTASTNFPGTTSGAQGAYGGGIYDAFVARLNPALTALTQATYLGGSGADDAYALAIHPTSGNVYVAGATTSTNFPGTTGGAQAANGGGQDAFVARLNPALTTTALTQATYLGGNGHDHAVALAIHPTSGDVYVAGGTISTNFPGTTGGAQPAHAVDGGFYDAFVARLNPALTTTALTQATYLGGSGNDNASAIVIHPTSGDVYVAGLTDSTNFPGTAGGAQAANDGGQDAFVARLNPALTTTALAQATYLGRSGSDSFNTIALSIAIHPTSGDVYVAGSTTSTNFPGTTGGAQAANGGGFDAFVARLNPALTTTALTQATYLGGSGNDYARALAIHPTSGDIYVAGQTYSTNFPGTTGGAQAANPSSNDAFVARLTSNLTSASGSPTLTISKSAPSSVVSGQSLTYTITYGNTGSANASTVAINDLLPAGTSFVSATGGGTFNLGVITWNIGALNAGVTGQTVSFTVTVTATSGSIFNNTYSIGASGVSAVSGAPVTTSVTSGGGGGSPTLTISKSAASSVVSGQNLTYTITYGNTGTAAATGASISDTVPTGTTFSSASNGGVVTLGAVTWNIGTLNAGVTGQTVSFSVTVNSPSGSINNATYSIAATGVSRVAGSPISTTVTPGGGGSPVLTLGKSAPSSVVSGQNLTYTITYGNSGTAAASGVILSDTMPSGASFVSATNGGTLNAGAVTWNLGSLAAGLTGQTVSFTVNVTATSGTVTNSIYSIQATGVSPVSGSPVSTTVSAAGPLPNLYPYQPSGWSDKIVVAKTAGTKTDATFLAPTDTLFVSWAVLNGGTAATAVRFYTELYVDGTLNASWYSDPPLNPNFYVYVENYSIGTLAAGTHTLRIKADSTGVIAESNEADNEYTKTITVGPSCAASATTLCLNSNRFAVTAAWQSSSASGNGTAVPIVNDTGTFWFFSQANYEILVKVVNGCSFNNFYWVFAGGLTNVKVTLRVTDTQTGLVKTYENPLNAAFLPIQDTAAISCP